MQVEILGVLRGARGPGQDMILAQLHGAKPEYTGVVEGMSGSPVYIDGKLLGSLSYRIGLFTKDPIAGITPIEQMLEVREMPIDMTSPIAARPLSAAVPLAGGRCEPDSPSPADSFAAGNMTFQPMETPLVMSGFSPEAIRFWQQQTAGTTLEPVWQAAALRLGGSSAPARPLRRAPHTRARLGRQHAAGARRPRNLRHLHRHLYRPQATACLRPSRARRRAGFAAHDHGRCRHHPGFAPEAFKIINTGATIGAFTQDRESAIRGILGAQAHMIPMHITVDAPTGPRKVNVEILDLPSLTPLAMQVVLMNRCSKPTRAAKPSATTSPGTSILPDFRPFRSIFGPPPEQATPASLRTRSPRRPAIHASLREWRPPGRGPRDRSSRSGCSPARSGHARAGAAGFRRHRPRRRHCGSRGHPPSLAAARTQRAHRHQAARPPRRGQSAPAGLRWRHARPHASPAPRSTPRRPILATVLAEARNQHPADRIYVSLLAPETQGEINGQTLTSLPLSVANALEPLRNTQDAGLNGESAVVAGEAPAGGVLSGFQILNVHIQPGGGLN